ncbi:Cof-like hydrolase [Coriobacterium glomerans PW2]|uniref:Cof-like hydrolase n=1 Tax=Coriobacterium glomerans (strain ATCC 49209 / DSM 20642 / JCM 10262 / PW2) TaxID=700015 RepID=F2NB49_CORGP|nr:Cof-type HAD-IIB family hydrolase [Coriobacterium glomerans]AEB07800.1 Cof-like hydrolase [Coriobacterium glomerans PW2]
MIRLIASDMDGTLMSGADGLSSRNASAIRSAQALGAEFIVVTGRSYEEAAPYLHDAGIACDYVLMNGSELRNDAGELLRSRYLSQDAVEACTKRLQEENVYLELYTTTGIFSTSSEDQLDWAIATKITYLMPGASPREAQNQAIIDFWKRTKICRFDEADELWNQRGSVGKIVMFSADLPKLSRLREEFAAQSDLNAACSFPVNLELTDKHANKGRALKMYARAKDIDLKDVMTIGDSYNDLSMLHPEFGYPVAVENAPDDVKRAAKYVTASNQADGVASAIERYLT